jgi:hypothetical protein
VPSDLTARRRIVHVSDVARRQDVMTSMSLKTSFASPSHQGHVEYGSNHPEGTCRALGHNVTAVDLIYKRSWQATDSDSRLTRARSGLSNTTLFSHGCRVLRFDGLNHVNHYVHRVHLKLTTKIPNLFPNKEPQRAAPVAGPVEVS